MKKIILALLLATACIVPHNIDDNIIPAKDPVWITAGASLDATQQLAHVPWFVRFPIDGIADISARLTLWHGKHIMDSGFDMALSQVGTTIIGGVIHGLKHPSHPCEWVEQKTKADTIVELKVQHGWCHD